MGIGVSSLATGEAQWLDPGPQMPFVPWPTEEVIRTGALAWIQSMLEQGFDPSEADGAMEEEADVKREVDAEVKRGGAVPELVRRESIAVGASCHFQNTTLSADDFLPVIASMPCVVAHELVPTFSHPFLVPLARTAHLRTLGKHTDTPFHTNTSYKECLQMAL